MPKHGPLQSPFENPCIPTPSPSGGTLVGTTGGWTLPDAPTETPNLSELGPLVTTVGGLADAPPPGTVIDIPGRVSSPLVPVPTLGEQ